jgi:hypothetical protein
MPGCAACGQPKTGCRGFWLAPRRSACGGHGAGCRRPQDRQRGLLRRGRGSAELSERLDPERLATIGRYFAMVAAVAKRLIDCVLASHANERPLD